jgi:4-amino-4-deoxy-L-arabinose transferase-like glycosyltransferase
MSKFSKVLFWALVLIFLARFSLLSQYPLIGTTEPRYAEIARKMLVTNDWVTLWVTDGVPLWGKPPLLFWLDSISVLLFGLTEFALRLPQFLFALMLVVLFWHWPYSQNDSQKSKDAPLITSLVFISTPVGFLSAGFVATDIYLTGGLMLSMFGFWIAMNAPNHPKASIWSWAFFVGVAIGLLAKGPLSIVLLGVALFLWILPAPVTRLIQIWKRLPWIRGSLLTALIAFPWYILHEIRTPGFLRHFIIGEHFERFLVKDWAGGRFAPSHGEPLGMIWWFAFESFLPWILLALPALYIGLKNKSESPKERLTPSADEYYLWCWILAPLLFFSLSKNILEAYVLPALPAFALLMQKVISRLITCKPAWRWSMGMAVLTPLVITVLAFFFKPVLETQSQKHLLTKHWAKGTPIYYVADLPPSAIFYTDNQAKEVGSYADAVALIEKQSTQKGAILVFPKAIFETLTGQQKSEVRIIESYAASVMVSRP